MLAIIGALCGDKLVEDAAKCPHICLVIVPLALQHLRTTVGKRAEARMAVVVSR